MNYLSLTKEQLKAEKDKAQIQYECLCKLGLKLDLSRGKPIGEQLDLSKEIFGEIKGENNDFCSETGFDCRNYGLLDGIPEAKKLFSELLSIPEKNLFIGGNSSLNMIFDAISRCLTVGTPDSDMPWAKYDKVKFICPAPGYDRHFSILETLGIEMITVEYDENGVLPIEKIEKLVAGDESIRGIICVPKYSNPTGATYSDDIVRRLASMKCAAKDFRIIWDNAYVIHNIYSEDTLADIFEIAKEYGNENRVMYFTSTSKITFPGAGVAIMALSDENMAQAKKIIGMQTISFDKLNQLRHVRFLKNADNVKELMKKHAAIVRPKFDIVLNTLKDELGDNSGIASWLKPNGGYFVSLNVLPGCAMRVWNLMKAAGVTLTGAGATYPYGVDFLDRNIRLAPTYSPAHELEICMQALVCCIRLAALEKLLAE